MNEFGRGWEFHVGIAEYYFKFIMRQRTLNDIQCDNAIFSATECNVKYVNFLPVRNIDVEHLFYCVLNKRFEYRMIFSHHERYVNRNQRFSVRLWFFKQNQFRGGIKRATLNRSDLSPVIPVIVGFCPHIWS